jgi:hypothetical protein
VRKAKLPIRSQQDGSPSRRDQEHAWSSEKTYGGRQCPAASWIARPHERSPPPGRLSWHLATQMSGDASDTGQPPVCRCSPPA